MPLFARTPVLLGWDAILVASNDFYKDLFPDTITLGVRLWLMFEEIIQPTTVDIGGLQGVSAWLACPVTEIGA